MEKKANFKVKFQLGHVIITVHDENGSYANGLALTVNEANDLSSLLKSELNNIHTSITKSSNPPVDEL